VNSTNPLRLLGVATACALLAACNCSPKVATRSSKLELPNPDLMGERTSLDFGHVQVNVKSVRKILVHNTGTLSLDISAAVTMAPFGVETTVPLSIDVEGTKELLISFTPTEPDQQVTGKLTLTSNDPLRMTAEVSLQGQGVAAVAKVVPSPIDFGDVYIGEMKKITVTLSNAGSDDLVVTAAAFNAATPTTVSGDLTKLQAALGQGTTAQVELTYAPTGPEVLTGTTLELTIDPMQGGSISVPIKGKSIYALPKLCFKLDGTGTETCADITTNSANLPLGSYCDNLLFGCGGDGGFSGKVYIKNEGNFPVSYSMNWDSLPYGSARCDGGSTGSDFVFSNSATLADGGRATKTSEPTVKLPMNATDPKPWETTPVSVTYRATSRCREDAADQARIIWTRQGDPTGSSRMPGTLFMTMSAASQLPRAVSSDWSCGTSSSPATVPCSAPFFGVNNAGDAPLHVTQVKLFEEFAGPPGQDAGGPNGGFFQDCALNTPGSGSPCDAFIWALVDGGNPNQFAPHTLAAASSPSVPTQKQLGQLTFGPAGRGCVDAGTACPNTPYRIYAVVTTDDPYGTTVISKISGFGM
jgi:hypothetical protein